ncbi:MAG: hypothetical protein WBP63_19205, partial [Silvibacterium sp.]
MPERKKPAGAGRRRAFWILIQAVNSGHTDSPACSSRGDAGADDDGGESASALKLNPRWEDVNFRLSRCVSWFSF